MTLDEVVIHVCCKGYKKVWFIDFHHGTFTNIYNCNEYSLKKISNE